MLELLEAGLFEPLIPPMTFEVLLETLTLWVLSSIPVPTRVALQALSALPSVYASAIRMRLPRPWTCSS